MGSNEASRPYTDDGWLNIGVAVEKDSDRMEYLVESRTTGIVCIELYWPLIRQPIGHNAR